MKARSTATLLVWAARRFLVPLCILVIALPCFVRFTDGIIGQTKYHEPAQVTTLHNDQSDLAVVEVVGFQNDARIVSRTLGRKLQAFADVVELRYAQRGFDVDQMYRLVFDELQRLKPKRVLLYGGSMGGQLSALFAERYQQEYAGRGLPLPYGKLLLLLDCTPGSADSLQGMPTEPKERARVLWLAKHLDLLGSGPILSRAKGPYIDGLWREGAPREPGIDPADIQAYRASFPHYPLPAMTAQAKFMASFNASDHDLTSVISYARYITSSSPDGDTLVRGSLAIREWTVAFPGLRHVVDPNRPANSHNSVMDWPTFIATQARTMFALAA